MTKIYIDDKDIKQIKEQNNGTIIFHKKHIKLYIFLLTLDIFPKVLVHIIMDYIDYDYIVEYVRYEGELCFKNIINNLTNTHLINNYNYSILEEKKINPKCNKGLSNTIIHFFDYFMFKYYNKENYIFNSDRKYYIDNNYYYPENYSNKTKNISFTIIKVNDHVELVNMIVIFKIFFHILYGSD